MTMTERDLHADLAETLHEAIIDGVATIADQLPPCAYRDFLHTIVQDRSSLHAAWWEAMGGPALVRMMILLFPDDGACAWWPELISALEPMISYFLFETASDDIGVGMVEADCPAQRGLLSHFHDQMLQAIETDAPVCALALPEVGSLLSQRVNCGQQARLLRFCTQEQAAALQDGRSLLLANIAAAQRAVQHTAGWRLASQIREAVACRYIGVEQLLQETPELFEDHLRIGEHTILARLVVLYYTGALEQVGLRSWFHSHTPQVLRVASLSAQLVRLLNDGGNLMLANWAVREQALAVLRQRLLSLPGTLSLRAALRQSDLLACPLWNRIAKDVLLGETNMFLDAMPNVDLHEATELLCENIRLGAEIYQDVQAELARPDAILADDRVAQVVERFLSLHQYMYGCDATSEEGEFIAVDCVRLSA